MREHKADMTVTKIDKQKNKLNSNSMTEHKTDMNITEKLNSISTAEYKTDMNMTEKVSSTFMTEH